MPRTPKKERDSENLFLLTQDLETQKGAYAAYPKKERDNQFNESEIELTKDSYSQV